MGKKGGKKIDTMRLKPYEIDVDIYLNKTGDSPRFEAKLGGESIYDTDYVNLRKKINERALVLFVADWKPIIEIHTTSPNSLEREVGWKFSFQRFYYAIVGNSYRELSWDTYQAWKERGVDDRSCLINASRHWRAAGTAENKGMPGDATKPICASHNGEEIRYQIGNYYRPYSEDLWNGLVKLRNVVAEVGVRLASLLGSDEGLARIASGATLQMLTERQGGVSQIEEKKAVTHQVDAVIMPKIICLCGSTRFTEQMLMRQWELTKQGFIVLSWCALPDWYFQGDDKTHIGDQEGVKEVVDEIHKRKIDLADEVFVLNIDGYIGESTRSEIEYAKTHGKAIRYLEE